MNKRVNRVLIELTSALAITTSSCFSPIVGGGRRPRIYAYSLDTFTQAYEANANNTNYSVVICNYDLLPVPYVFYYMDYGDHGAADDDLSDIETGFHSGGNAEIIISTTFYDSEYKPLFYLEVTQLIDFAWRSTDPVDHEAYRTFGGELSYEHVTEKTEDNRPYWGFTSSSSSRSQAFFLIETAGDSASVLEFYIPVDQGDIETYMTDIESYMDILSRNYAVLDNGRTRYVTIEEGEGI